MSDSLTEEKVELLLEGITPGDWAAVIYFGSVLLGPEVGFVVGPVVRFRARSSCFSPEDAKIMASAPALARLAISQGQELRTLKAQLDEMLYPKTVAGEP